MPNPRDSQGRYVSPRWVWFTVALVLALLMAARAGIIQVCAVQQARKYLVPLQAVSEFRDAWPTLVAVLLAILGVGLRIEAAILHRHTLKSDPASPPVPPQAE